MLPEIELVWCPFRNNVAGLIEDGHIRTWGMTVGLTTGFMADRCVGQYLKNTMVEPNRRVYFKYILTFWVQSNVLTSGLYSRQCNSRPLPLLGMK